MLKVWLYSLISVVIVSLISLIGVISISLSDKKLKNTLIYMISFSAGALLGDTFIHLLPEAVKEAGFGLNVSIYVLVGIGCFFVIEKVIHWRHCHMPITKNHKHPVAIMNLIGDGVHNLMDGIIIGASYLASIPVGIATTIAVLLHEIPQEIADFGVLIHGGFTKKKALFFNFLFALTSVVGVIITLIIGSRVMDITHFLIPFTAGGFIYIASSDLIPEMHKETTLKKSVIQLLFFTLGILVMLALTLLE
ncbi:MAG: ZIP family metal transporter [Nanoarchaeota archaeon]|nr:ZIP family metal transporter [Nanoarchaeota archaeon]MBU1270389.1 ZIP family metal transporter [Nanoarchaeota archaeon]MBU1604820.1 ZIP family metal transporter [Nanoarchaeota archaeon]MBU2442803.1 ZIP family metal transporter [Nanoarchaeota archaeon]